MSEPNVLVNFRLDQDQPLRFNWLATDGVPGDGYKAQITADQARRTARTLAMDSSAILEQTAPDPSGGIGGYMLTFNGMVGFAADHPDRKRVDKLDDQEIEYDLEFVHEDTGPRRRRERRTTRSSSGRAAGAQAVGEAMRDDTPSRTAACVAAARGMGSLLPDEAQLVDDPYGAAFASPAFARLVDRRRGCRPLAQMPGLQHWILYMQVRTRVIDDALRKFVARGGRQLVLLGAGYDCRALRMPELADARVFEVDHPATQGHKRACSTQLRRRVAGALRDVGLRDAADGRPARRARRRRARPERAGLHDLGRRHDVSDRGRDRRVAARDPRVERAGLAARDDVLREVAHRAAVARDARDARPWSRRSASRGSSAGCRRSCPRISRSAGSRSIATSRMSDAARELLPPAYAALVGKEDRRFSLAAPEAIGLAS